MSYPLPEPEPTFEAPTPENPWRMADLVVFAVFFLLTVLFLPLTAIRIWHIFKPDLRIADLTAVDQVLVSWSRSSMGSPSSIPSIGIEIINSARHS